MKKNEIKAENKKKKISLKAKGIIALILAVVVFTSGLTGYLFISHQAAAEIYDRTQGDMRGLSVESREYADTDANAVFSDSVKLFTDSKADAVNATIKSVNVSNFGIEIATQGKSDLDDLGIGDIFFLDGSKSTPLGEPFIGKISNVGYSGENRTYQLETPAVDEVFDVLKIDYDEAVKIDELSEIKTFDGVEIEMVDDIDKAISLSTEAAEGSISTLECPQNTASEEVTILASSGSTDALVLNIDVDLFKALNLKEKDIFKEKYTKESLDPDTADVYVTDTGKCYHRESCGYLKRNKNKKSLRNAIKEDYSPCRICKPPVVDGGFDPFLKVKGKVGLETLDFNVIFDWDIANSPTPIKNLGASCHGNFIADVRLSSGFEYELSGQKTKVELTNCLKIEGLKEKLIPLAFVSFTGGMATATTQEGIRALTSVPITLGAMIYIDVDGKITAQAEVYYTYRREFSVTANIVKDSQLNCDFSCDFKDPKESYGVNFEVKGDVDTHIGCSLLAYVFNLNLLDISPIKVGVEAEGMLSYNKTNNEQKAYENGLSYNYSIRGYVKIGELKINLKCKLDLWLFNINAEMKFDYLWQDITIFEFGSKSSTRYKPGLMSYSSVTASDEDSIYYKNEDGCLIREVNGSRSILYSDEFFSICGIDASYLYVLKPDDGGAYKIYRISKKDGIDKKIADGVKMCLTIDEDNIYYTSSFDDKTILKLDRSKLKEETYILMPQSVRFMEKQDNDFYVVAQDESRFFMFSNPAYCYIVGKDYGVTRILKELGDNPEVKDYYTEEYDDYTYAARMVSDGNLRSTASQVCWVSKDGSSSVVTDCLTGWNPCDDGIFTTLANDSEGLPYKIVLYRASDGSQVKVLEVNSDQAFFTLCKATNSSWYYIDQTDEALILYVTDANFGSKREIKRFSLQDIHYDLSRCSMTIMNNRCYFYTMPDEYTCHVIYRYDIY